MSVTNLYNVQLMGVVFSLVMIISVFLMVKARKLRENYSLAWFSIGLFSLAMSVSQDWMEQVSRVLGVDYAPSAFFAILIASAYLLLLKNSVSLSSLKTHNKVLTQELGLTKLRLEQLEKKLAQLAPLTSTSCSTIDGTATHAQSSLSQTDKELS